MSATSPVALLEDDDRLRLPAGTNLRDDHRGRLVLGRGPRRFAIGPLLPGVAAAVRSLATAAATAPDLARVAGVGDGAAAQLEHVLGRLADRGWLERTAFTGGSPVATLRPIGLPVAGPRPAAAAGSPVALSRFAFVHRDGGALVVESPRSSWTVVLDDPRAAGLVAALARPVPPAELDAVAFGLPDGAAAALVRLLDSAGLLVAEPAGAGGSDEDRLQEMAQWSLVDLAFHTASRFGHQAGGYGGTFPLKDRFDPLTERRPLAGRPIDLTLPDLARAAASDPPFTTVLERRRSVRAHDDASPVTLDRLGEFLYRSAGERRRPGAGGEDEAARPYPTGGGLYELELYPVVGRCDGLGSGLYHYDPVGHRLGLLADDGPAVRRLLDDARARSLMPDTPQVLVVVAARFGRVMYKYEAIAYAVILKNVGALYQTMYCVATAMGLAPCALGGGSSEAFCSAAGTDPLVESSVGEFVIGSRTPHAAP